MSNTKKNVVYNTLYHILTLIVPLITAPYLARTIGAEGVGIYSYTASIAQYFILFAMLGLSNYGNRSIAKVRDDKKKLSKTFFSIYAVQLISSALSIFAYVAFIALDNQYKNYSIIQFLYVASAIFDISWFFFGIEKFKTTVTRNTIIKLLSTAAIFIFVQTPNDLPYYVIIMALSFLLSQLALWPFLFKEIDLRVTLDFKEIKKHILPNLKLFIPVIAISLYNIMDKIMLGAICNAEEVGYYSNAEKIIQIPITLISSLGTVMLPKISNLVANRKQTVATKYIQKSLAFVMFITAPLCCGLFATGRNFSIIFYGENFVKTGILIEVLAIVIIIKAWANVLRTQYLIPHEKDKVYIWSVCLGAIINLLLNALLIPSLQSIGACIGTIAAEFIVMAYQAFAVRRELPIHQYIKQSLPFLAKAIIMFGFIYPLNLVNLNPYVRLAAQILAGVAIYSLLNFRYLSSLLNLSRLKKLKRN